MRLRRHHLPLLAEGLLVGGHRLLRLARILQMRLEAFCGLQRKAPYILCRSGPIRRQQTEVALDAKRAHQVHSHPWPR